MQFQSGLARLQRTASDSGIRHLLLMGEHHPQIVEVNKNWKIKKIKNKFSKIFCRLSLKGRRAANSVVLGLSGAFLRSRIEAELFVRIEYLPWTGWNSLLWLVVYISSGKSKTTFHYFFKLILQLLLRCHGCAICDDIQIPFEIQAQCLLFNPAKPFKKTKMFSRTRICDSFLECYPLNKLNNFTIIKVYFSV